MSKHVLNTRLGPAREGASTCLRLDRSILRGRVSSGRCADRGRGSHGGLRTAPRRRAPAAPDRLTEADLKHDISLLYRERAARLISHFASALPDRASAEEIVHEAFARFAALSVARRLLIVRPDAYLYRTCLNLVRDRARSDERALRARLHCDPSGSRNPMSELEHRDTLRRLERAMLRLKPKTREIFLAKRLDGMSYAEIAARSGLSVKGVEKHMSKAIAMIDRAMERDRG